MQQFMQGLYDICNTFSPFVYLLVAVSLIIIGAAQYEETVPAGRKWITIRTGSQNGGGHSYAGATGPALLLDKDRTIKPADVFSLSFTPINSGNFGFFYSYVNDNDFLYIGYDSSSKWYW